MGLTLFARRLALASDLAEKPGMTGMPASLDHPLRSALWGEQAHLAVGGELARRYRPEFGPLAALAETSPAALAQLGELVRDHGPLALVQPGDALEVAGAVIEVRAEGVQMYYDLARHEDAPADPRIAPLAEADYAEMLALAQLTQPGPFAQRTGDLGPFRGVRDRTGRLIAMAGQRMRFSEYCEISGVCTHPDAQGLGMGTALMRDAATRIMAEGRKPILHVHAENSGAIALYRRLGFTERMRSWLTVYVPAP